MEGCTSAGVLAGWSIAFRLKCKTNLNSQQEGDDDLFTVYCVLGHSKGKWAGWLARRSFLIHRNSNVVPRCKREGARVRTPNCGQGAYRSFHWQVTNGPHWGHGGPWARFQLRLAGSGSCRAAGVGPTEFQGSKVLAFHHLISCFNTVL